MEEVGEMKLMKVAYRKHMMHDTAAWQPFLGIQGARVGMTQMISDPREPCI